MIRSTAKPKAGPRSLDDLAAARVVRKAAEGIAIPDDQFERLDELWAEGVELAGQDGPPGIDEWLGWVEVRAPGRAAAIREALDRARSDPTGEGQATAEAEGEEAPPSFLAGSMGSTEFFRAQFPREWLAKGLIVKGQPCLIGGPKKSLKTSFLVDAMVSLATGRPILGDFAIPRPVKTWLISGESGEATIQETARRVCKAKGILPEDLEGMAYWHFKLPRLSSDRDMAELAAYIRDNGIEVVIIDPLYLCLLSGAGRRIDPANLFDMGPLLKQITDVILAAGATPIFVHHFRKNRENPYAPPDMDDLAFAGIQEFARQWVLIGRRERYTPGTGEHKLWLSVGGSMGHSGEWAVDVSEGVLEDDFRDRQWDVRIHRASEARTEAREQAAAEKAEKQAERDRAREMARGQRRERDAWDAKAALEVHFGGRGTKNKLRDHLGWNAERTGAALAFLLTAGKIAEGPVEVAGPRGRGTQCVQGYVVTPDNPDNPGHTPDESPPSGVVQVGRTDPPINRGSVRPSDLNPDAPDSPPKEDRPALSPDPTGSMPAAEGGA